MSQRGHVGLSLWVFGFSGSFLCSAMRWERVGQLLFWRRTRDTEWIGGVEERCDGFSFLRVHRSGGVRPSGGRSRASVQLRISDWPA